MGSILLITIFGILLVIGVPIAFALGLTVIFTVSIVQNIPMMLVFQQMYQGVDTFTLLALPMFMLAGELMMRTGIIDDILLFCNAVVGRLRGGLGQVNVVASMLFAGISGSAVSDTAAIGSALIPSMKKNGYDAEFSVALTGASSVIGPIIPPSIAMILYGSITSVSIAGLFAAGLVPGILLGVGMMTMVYILSRTRRYPKAERSRGRKQLAVSLGKGVPAMLVPVIVLGGILGGVFTPTEASAVACAYAAFLGVIYYRTLTPRVFAESVVAAMKLSGSVLLIVAAATPIGWLIAIGKVPEAIAHGITVISLDPILVLLLINAFLLVLGSIMEANVNVLIFTPVLAPVAVGIGIDPLHFGIIFVLNIIIGLATPPFGVCLFVAAGIGKIPVERAMIAVLPFIGIMVSVLLLVTFFPDLVLFLPKILGLY